MHTQHAAVDDGGDVEEVEHLRTGLVNSCVYVCMCVRAHASTRVGTGAGLNKGLFETSVQYFHALELPYLRWHSS